MYLALTYVPNWRRSRLFLLSAANPTFSTEELQYQLEGTQAKLLLVHPSALQTALGAARAVGLSNDRIVLIEPASNAKQQFITLDEAISEGLQHPKPFVDRRLKPGEAKTKIAVSPLITRSRVQIIENSGSSIIHLPGRRESPRYGFHAAPCFFELKLAPQSVAISHYSIVANVLQKAKMNRVNDPTVSPERRRFAAGSISMNGMWYHSASFPIQ